VILFAVGAQGFGSYFYLTEYGVSVRPPLEFSMRHNEWKDVTIASVRCRYVTRKLRFRYFIKMSDGCEVELSNALLGATAKLRAASAARLAASISRLSIAPGILYEVDVSQDALATLGRRYGDVLSNALREQVLAHGGTLQS
jgi:hypothetical protein